MAKANKSPEASTAEFIKTFNRLMTSRTAWEVWADFVSMYAISISNAVDKSHFEARESEFEKIKSKYKADEIEVIVQLIAITIEALESAVFHAVFGYTDDGANECR